MIDLEQILAADPDAQAAAADLIDAANTGDSIQLPFPALNLWVHNGKSDMKMNADRVPALYFGGFACNEEQYDELIASGDMQPMAKWGLAEFASTSGEDYTNYLTRAIWIAPIAGRESWLNGNDNSRYHHFKRETGHTRQHIQILCALGVMDEGGTITHNGMCVVSAKGYQGKYLRKALKAFWKGSLEARKAANAAGSSITPAMFWHRIGTFGNTPDYQMMGSGQKKSSITPVTASPNPIAPEHIQKLFVGLDLIKLFNEKRFDAEEWLHAWDGDSESQTNGHTSTSNNNASPDPQGDQTYESW